MFSLKKSNLPRPLAWVRGKIGSKSRRSVDVERRASSGASAGGGNVETSPPPGPSNAIVGRVIMVRTRESANAGVAESSRSEPTIGPRNATENSRLVVSGRVIDKAHSFGATGVIASGGGSDSVSGRNNKVEEAAGLRKRRNVGGTAEVAGPSGAASGAASLNRMNLTDNRRAITGSREMEMVLMGCLHPPPAAAAVVSRPKYLHAFLDAMYFSGTSRRVPNDRRGKQGWTTRLVNVLILLLFLANIFFSHWESFNKAKFSCLHFSAGEGMSFFMDFSYNIICLLTKAYTVIRFTFLNDETDQMLNLIEEYDREYDPQAHCHCTYWKWIIVATCICTFAIAFAETIFDRGITDWTFDFMGREKSFEFSQHIYLWSSTDLGNRSMELAFAYGTIETYKIGYVITSCLLSLFDNFHLGSLRDLALTAVFVIFLIIAGLMKGVNDTMENAPKWDIAACRRLQARREFIWKQYRKTKLVIAATNKVLDTFLVLLHVDNLLLSGFFASLCIDSERDDAALFFFIYNGLNLLKAELTYFLGGRIYAQNETLRRWLRNWSCHTGKITVDGEEYDALVLMDELEKEPLAIGSGMFQINLEFHAKYVGFVGSLVLFLADNKKKMQ